MSSALSSSAISTRTSTFRSSAGSTSLSRYSQSRASLTTGLLSAFFGGTAFSGAECAQAVKTLITRHAAASLSLGETIGNLFDLIRICLLRCADRVGELARMLRSRLVELVLHLHEFGFIGSNLRDTKLVAHRSAQP